jgi:hypothetical protein
VASGKICRRKFTRDGDEVVEALCNFDARIVQQVVHDDGAERRVSLALEGRLADGRPLQRVEVPAARFAGMDWVIPQWGVSPVFRAGNGTRDHLRAALQVLSGDVPGRTVYGHTGWRRSGDDWLYLHAGGAVGGGGAAGGIDVSLPGALGRYELPAPPSGERLVRAVRASLGLLRGLAAVALPSRSWRPLTGPSSATPTSRCTWPASRAPSRASWPPWRSSTTAPACPALTSPDRGPRPRTPSRGWPSPPRTRC